MPFIIGGLIGGATLGAGALNAFGASSAADTQAKAANKAADLSQSNYSAIQQSLLPYLQTGTTANQVLAQNYFGINSQGGYDPNAPFLQPISKTVGAPPNPNDASLLAAFKASPGYNYEVQQGTDAVQNAAAGRTGAISGNMMKALQSNAEGLASTDWWTNYNALVNNYASRYNDIVNQRNTITSGLGNLAGSGQNAAVSTGGFGTSAAQTTGSNYNLAGSAKAAGTLGVTNAATGALNNTSLNSYLGSLLGGSTGGSSTYNPYLYFGSSGGSVGGGSDAGYGY